jgi:ATP-binding cassette subfamily F protein 3
MSFTDKPLFKNVSFDIKRGERVALIGANGIGKTTLIRIIMDRLKQTSGSVKVGANVVIGYYDQEQADLNTAKTIFDEISDCFPTLTTTRIRNVLAAFVFTGDAVFKTIGSLSGGEKGRVALAKLMLSNANLLILDEPTNHLDMESKQILENAINNYTGTVLYISHDRYFINSTAQKVIELTENGVNTYLGNYDYYVEKRQVATTELKSVSVETEAKSDWQEQKAKQAVDRKLRNTIKRIEKEIEQVEKELDEASKQLEDSSVATDAFKAAEVYKQVESLEERLMELYEEYEKYEKSE